MRPIKPELAGSASIRREAGGRSAADWFDELGNSRMRTRRALNVACGESKRTPCPRLQSRSSLPSATCPYTSFYRCAFLLAPTYTHPGSFHPDNAAPPYSTAQPDATPPHSSPHRHPVCRLKFNSSLALHPGTAARIAIMTAPSPPLHSPTSRPERPKVMYTSRDALVPS